MTELERNRKLIHSIGLHGCSEALASVAQKIKRFEKNPSRVLIIGAAGTGKESVVKALARTLPNSKEILAISGELFSNNPDGFIESYHGGDAVHHPFAKLKGGRADPNTPYSGGVAIIYDVHKINPANQIILGSLFDDDHIPPKLKVIATARLSFLERFAKGEISPSFFLGFDLRIQMPRLIERLEDLDELVVEFVSQIERSEGPRKKWTPAATDELKKYHWPGNVRELYNVMYKLMTEDNGQSVHSIDVYNELEERRNKPDRYNFDTH